MKPIRKHLVAAAAIAALAAPSSAFAQSSVLEGYNDPAGDSSVSVDDSSSQRAKDPGGQLPFTGLDLGLMALAGGALVTLGAGMRRFTRPLDTA